MGPEPIAYEVANVLWTLIYRLVACRKLPYVALLRVAYFGGGLCAPL